MDRSDNKSGGLLSSLRRTASSLAGLAQCRFELFVVELQEEKLRALKLIVWLVIALALGMAGLLVGLGALAFFLWDVAGYYGVGALALAALAAGAGVLWRIHDEILNGRTPFAESLEEFRKDRECLRSEE